MPFEKCAFNFFAFLFFVKRFNDYELEKGRSVTFEGILYPKAILTIIIKSVQIRKATVVYYKDKLFEVL